ncbi:MAG: DUF559 domain-containing protein [Bacteroidetes bacterium]|nr:DUF559 domain-containing protein [Bacteroidota bacterium]
MKVPPKIFNEATSCARELRKNATESEEILWNILRDRKIIGIKFYRQRPVYYLVNDKIYFFIVDFCADELKLIIEADGGYHEEIEEKDHLRDNVLEAMGYSILHFTNHQILDDRETIILTIKLTIKGLKSKNV